MSPPPASPPSPLPTRGAAPPAGGADPSMEDILASIRRILSEDEGVAAPPPEAEAPPLPAAVPAPAPYTPPPPTKPAVLPLDMTMLVEEPLLAPRPALAAVPPPPPPPAFHAELAPPAEPPVPTVVAAPPLVPPPFAPPAREAPLMSDNSAGLLGAEASAAAASSVGSLLRTLASERQQQPQTQVTRGGPTIEDVVREEIRPILKEWLDANLPAIVERLVRAEIERVVGRVMS